jgi:hypothetical protein
MSQENVELVRAALDAFSRSASLGVVGFVGPRRGVLM